MPGLAKVCRIAPYLAHWVLASQWRPRSSLLECRQIAGYKSPRFTGHPRLERPVRPRASHRSQQGSMKKSLGKIIAGGRSTASTRTKPMGAMPRRPLTSEPFRNIHDYLSHKLGREIVGGFYQPGDQLPNELDLRDHLSVSRAALREAYRVLTAKGLITS